MSDLKFENMSMEEMVKYMEQQQLEMVTEMEAGMLKAGKSDFRFCGVGPFDLIPGFELWLSSELLSAIAGGTSAAAAIATLIPDPTLSKAIAALLGTIAAIITVAVSDGKGLFIRGSLTPLAIIKVCYQ